MELSTDTLRQTLLTEEKNDWMNDVRDWCLRLSLPILVILSNMGMLILKTGERNNSIITIITGLTLESTAFAIYPISMRLYSLRIITVAWSGGSIITATIGGKLLFDEVPSNVSLFGCIIVICGIIITAFG
jgi:multidrug transporter EmrE-like cation transporter